MRIRIWQIWEVGGGWLCRLGRRYLGGSQLVKRHEILSLGRGRIRVRQLTGRDEAEDLVRLQDSAVHSCQLVIRSQSPHATPALSDTGLDVCIERVYADVRPSFTIPSSPISVHRVDDSPLGSSDGNHFAGRTEGPLRSLPYGAACPNQR